MRGYAATEGLCHMCDGIPEPDTEDDEQRSCVQDDAEESESEESSSTFSPIGSEEDEEKYAEEAATEGNIQANFDRLTHQQKGAYLRRCFPPPASQEPVLRDEALADITRGDLTNGFRLRER